MKKTGLPLLLVFGYALLLPSFSSADTVVEEIIARINNEIVTRTEYIRSRDQLQAGGAAAGRSQCGSRICR